MKKRIVCDGNICRIINDEEEINMEEDVSSVTTITTNMNTTVLEDVMADALKKICSYLSDTDVPYLLSVSKYFYTVLHPNWWSIVNQSPYLQKMRRYYYHGVAKSLSIVYSSIEKAQVKKFVGFNSKLGVSAYSYISSGINVFVRVRPPAMGHTVGVTYTFTKWREDHIAYGWWVENRAGEEIWRINISYDESLYDEMWFSVFVKDSSGHEAWDTNNAWNYAANLLTIPIKTYDNTSDPAVLQHERNQLSKSDESEEDDFVEEVWFNVNHVMCG